MELAKLLAEHRDQIEHRASFRRTLCEVLREIWDIIDVVKEEDLRQELQARIVVAYDMGKRMSRKLREYKHGWDEGFWEDNHDREADLRRRSKRAGSDDQPGGDDED